MTTRSLVMFALALFVFSISTPLLAQQNTMSFFVTSVGLGNGGDLGGLAGADRHCQSLAAMRPWPRCLRYVVIRAVHQKPSLPRFANGRSDRTPRCTMRSSSRARVVIEVRCHSQPFPVRSAPGCCRESGHGRPGPRSVGQPPATNAVFGRSRHRLGRGTRRPGEDEDRGKPKQGHRPRRRGRRLKAQRRRGRRRRLTPAWSCPRARCRRDSAARRS